jgi:hypothetical protein
VEERRASGSCTFTEETVVEQLSADGKTEGKVIRRHQTTVKGAQISERVLVSKKIEGDPSSLLQKDQARPEAQLSAFHPSQQPLYVFSEEPSPEPQRAKIRFAPREKHAKRLKGVAWIDRASGKITLIEGAPSDRPAMLQEFQIAMTLGDTPCGQQLTHLSMKGKGGVLFFTMRFRAETTLSGHRAP